MTANAYMYGVTLDHYLEIGLDNFIAWSKELAYMEELQYQLEDHEHLKKWDKWYNVRVRHTYRDTEPTFEELIKSINQDDFEIAIIDSNEPGGNIHVVVGCTWIAESFLDDYCDEVNGRVRQD